MTCSLSWAGAPQLSKPGPEDPVMTGSLLFPAEHLSTSTYQPTMFSPLSSAEEKVHKHFPKTWIWDLYSVG